MAEPAKDQPTEHASIDPWGEDDSEVWIPPQTDCLSYRPEAPCPHCGNRYHHVRTGRCANCGRRPGQPATRGGA